MMISSHYKKASITLLGMIVTMFILASPATHSQAGPGVRNIATLSPTPVSARITSALSAASILVAQPFTLQPADATTPPDGSTALDFPTMEFTSNDVVNPPFIIAAHNPNSHFVYILEDFLRVDSNNYPKSGYVLQLNITTGQSTIVYDAYALQNLILAPNDQKAVLIHFVGDSEGKHLTGEVFCVLDMRTGVCQDTGKGEPMGGASIEWIDDQHFFYANGQPFLTLVDANTLQNHQVNVLPQGMGIGAAALIPGTHQVFAAVYVGLSIPYDFYIYDLDTGKLRHLPYNSLDNGIQVFEVTVAPNGQFATVLLASQVLRVIDINTGKIIAEIKHARVAGWSPDSQNAYVDINDNGTITSRVEIATGKIIPFMGGNAQILVR